MCSLIANNSHINAHEITEQVDGISKYLGLYKIIIGIVLCFCELNALICYLSIMFLS